MPQYIKITEYNSYICYSARPIVSCTEYRWRLGGSIRLEGHGSTAGIAKNNSGVGGRVMDADYTRA